MPYRPGLAASERRRAPGAAADMAAGGPWSKSDREEAINDPDLVAAVWDRRSHLGVLAAGGRVVPANLDAGIYRAERSAVTVE
jgi:hypothetical protein